MILFLPSRLASKNTKLDSVHHYLYFIEYCLYLMNCFNNIKSIQISVYKLRKEDVSVLCFYIQMVFYNFFTSFSLSFILSDGCIFLPPVIFLVAPIRYQIRDLGCESTTFNRNLYQFLLLLIDWEGLFFEGQFNKTNFQT